MPTRNRIIVAVTIVIISALLLLPFYSSYSEIKKNIDERYDELTKPSEPYSFEVPLYIDFESTTAFGTVETSDIAFLCNDCSHKSC